MYQSRKFLIKRTKTDVHKCTASTETSMSPDFEDISSVGTWEQNCKKFGRLNFHMSHFSDLGSSFDFGELNLCLKVPRGDWKGIQCWTIS